jgi:hypothetical protein
MASSTFTTIDDSAAGTDPGSTLASESTIAAGVDTEAVLDLRGALGRNMTGQWPLLRGGAKQREQQQIAHERAGHQVPPQGDI